MQMQVVVPRISARLLWWLAVLWVAMLAAAAWLGTHEGVWWRFSSQVLGAIAGAAFGAIGVSAWLTRGQLKELRRTSADLVVNNLRTACEATTGLLRDLFEVLKPRWPILTDGTLNVWSLVDVLGPPSNPHSGELVESIRRSVLVSGGRTGELHSVLEESLQSERERANEASELYWESAELRWRLNRDRLETLSRVAEHGSDDAAAEVAVELHPRVSAALDELQAMIEPLATLGFEGYPELTRQLAVTRSFVRRWEGSVQDPSVVRTHPFFVVLDTHKLLAAVNDLSSALSIVVVQAAREYESQALPGGDADDPNRAIEALQESIEYAWESFGIRATS